MWVEDVKVAVCECQVRSREVCRKEECSRPAEFISTPRKLLEPWDGGVRGAVCASLLWVRVADIIDRPIFPRTLPDCWLRFWAEPCIALLYFGDCFW